MTTPTSIKVATHGRYVDLAALTPEDVDIWDVTHSLSHLCRFNGHSTRFYSVAEHTLLVASLVHPKFRLHALLHDAHEAYMGDITPAVARMLDKNAVDRLKRYLDSIIYQRFSLVPSEDSWHEVNRADRVALHAEFKHFFGQDRYTGLTMTDEELTFAKYNDGTIHRRLSNPGVPSEVKTVLASQFDVYKSTP